MFHIFTYTDDTCVQRLIDTGAFFDVFYRHHKEFTQNKNVT